MKNLLVLLLLFTISGLTAQVTSAKVTYRETIELNFANEKDIDPGMKALLDQMPKQSTSQATLLFNASAATYSKNPATAEDMSATKGNMTITFEMSDATPETYYVDLKKQKTLQTRSIFDKPFQIEDDIPAIDWTLTDISSTDEESTLPVKKATGITAGGDTLTAWYTTSLPVSVGPLAYGGLPGLIVKLERNNTTYQVTNIELLSEEPEIAKPFTKGKTVTLEKFKKIEKQKVEAFQKNMKGKMDGQVITIGG